MSPVSTGVEPESYPLTTTTNGFIELGKNHNNFQGQCPIEPKLSGTFGNFMSNGEKTQLWT